MNYDNRSYSEQTNSQREYKKMELRDTVALMESTDFKDRFKAEYYQLKLRMVGLAKMLEDYRNGTLKFKPKCSYDLLNNQFTVMDMYALYLEERAVIEDIQL